MTVCAQKEGWPAHTTSPHLSLSVWFCHGADSRGINKIMSLKKDPSLKPRKLPIGIQSFSKLREQDCYYVDKTPLVARLAEQGGAFFLSRPRRFGKSLFLDTLAEAFSGNKALFVGLYLENHWDWSKKHPVIRVSFAAGVLRHREELSRHIRRVLKENALQLGVELSDPEDEAGSLAELITESARRFGQRAVVLVDEYDKPILDHLTEPDVAKEMREGLRNLYSVLKDRDADLRLVFLTGVSKFSRVSIFSGLNNLYDLTLDPTYGTICGYTDDDIDQVFAPELEGLNRDEIRHWYNGYRWGQTSVYNPFDVLLLFQSREFRSWWFETGTPTFLVNWLKERRFYTPRLEKMWSNESLLSAFDVDHIEPEAMLWQTGYLTIRDQVRYGAITEYQLTVPNYEVRQAFNHALFTSWCPQGSDWMRGVGDIIRAFQQGQTEVVHQHFQRLYASIPHDWYRNNPMAQYEGYYASVFYSHLAALGLDLVAEDVSQEGQCDLVIRHANVVWVIEFKLVDHEATGESLRQLQEKNYAAKYRKSGVQVIELGVEFSRSKRQVVGWFVG
jgi:hypothetical protein